MDELDRLFENDPEEYSALYELAGNEKEHGLGGLPLALGQAGCYISWRRDSFAKYVMKYKQVRRSHRASKLFREVEDLGLAEEQRTIWTTWDINFKQLSGKARNVLVAFALLDDAPVPESLMMKLGSDFESDVLEYQEIVEEELLDGSSLLDRVEHDGEITFKMHRLMREFVLKHTGEETREALDMAVSAIHASVVQALSDISLSIKMSYKIPRTRILVRHAVRVLKHFCELQSHDASVVCIKELTDLLGFEIRSSFGTDRAMETLVLGHTFKKTLMGKIYGVDRDHKYLAAVLHDCPRAEMQVGNYEDAWILFFQSISMNSRLFGKDADLEEIAASYHELGMLSRLTGNLVKAESYCKKSLQIMRRIHGETEDHPELANILASLGHIYQDRSEYERAENFYRQCLAMEQRYFGADSTHPYIANTIRNLACLASKKGDSQKAERLFREALKRDLLFFGQKQAVAYRTSKLASVLLDTGVLGEAERMFGKKLEILRCLNEKEANPKDMALVSCKQDNEEIDQAEELYRDCLEIERKLRDDGIHNVDVAAALYNLRDYYNRRDYWDWAM